MSPAKSAPSAERRRHFSTLRSVGARMTAAAAAERDASLSKAAASAGGTALGAAFAAAARPSERAASFAARPS